MRLLDIKNNIELIEKTLGEKILQKEAFIVIESSTGYSLPFKLKTLIGKEVDMKATTVDEKVGANIVFGEKL